MPIEPGYYLVGQYTTFSYFFYFLLLVPLSYHVDALSYNGYMIKLPRIASYNYWRQYDNRKWIQSF